MKKIIKNNILLIYNSKEIIINLNFFEKNLCKINKKYNYINVY